MRSAAQNRASKTNGALSRGPVTAEGKSRSCLNSLRDGIRSRALILPGENRQEFESELDQLIEDLQPCDGTELKLVHEIASAAWMHRRAKRAQFERLKSEIERASASRRSRTLHLLSIGSSLTLAGRSRCTAPPRQPAAGRGLPRPKTSMIPKSRPRWSSGSRPPPRAVKP